MRQRVHLLGALAMVTAPCFCVSPRPASAQEAAAGAVAWDQAFPDRSGTTTIHFVAQYLDARGTIHQLEEWRQGEQHLRRNTDGRLDIHADAASRPLPGQPPQYTWQILDLQQHVAHRVSTAGMLRLGMLYSYYSMSHVLVRPAGHFIVQPASAPAAASSPAALPLPAVPHGQTTCQWWQIDSPGQPSTRVCWLARYGVPAQILAQSPTGWRRLFSLRSIEARPIPLRIFLANTAGFQVRNVDELESED